MKKIAALGALGIGAVLGLAACHSSPIQDRFDAAGRDIHSARNAGARKYAPDEYHDATSSLASAQDCCANACDQSARAVETREAAQREMKDLAQRTAEAEASLGEAEERQAGTQARLAALERRQAQLRARGLTERELDNAIGDDLALAQVDVSKARAELKAARAEREFCSQRRQELGTRIAAASDQLAAAGQELLHATTLADQAGAAARAAEARAIAKRKAELEVH